MTNFAIKRLDIHDSLRLLHYYVSADSQVSLHLPWEMVA